MEMNAPITLELSIYALNEETGTQAIVKANLPIGQYPTPDTIRDVIKQAEDALPEGYALMNKSEFFNTYLQEQHGATETFATPGSPEFDDNYVQGSDE
ncbi:hypothetical protein [Acinetobacter variabilis]|uniref:Uncharacterized protein n=1 Tax=Acinetobacter variabilis TaxID=70346 RepID=N8WZQ1_9GAMM|nr:hypothetical protein [Acinetobacter variabilis]ENV00390.1 hypothetical protein F969_00621 [Acinetobacter variabilis]